MPMSAGASFHGFVRVAAAVPMLRVGDCAFNAEHIAALLARAERESAAVVVFPELAITGYTCADLFQQTVLQRAALETLIDLVRDVRDRFSGLAVVGVPLLVDDQLFNCAAVFHDGRLLGIVPKSYIPNYKEFYERRWFAPAANARSRHLVVQEEPVPFGADLLFEATNVDGLTVGVEICEDLWAPIPCSSFQALAGATVLLNLSASNDLIAKGAYREQLVLNQSARCIAGYAYASCGVFESTTDVVFGGHCLLAENGTLLAEASRFQRDDSLWVTDFDLDRLRVERARTNSFGDSRLYLREAPPFRRIGFELHRAARPKLARAIDAHPFVPRGHEQLRARCEEIFHIQVAGLAKRLEHIGKPSVAIGVSGGLDSTLALLVTCKTMDLLRTPRDRIRALTMPGFGTTARTRGNAHALMRELGVSGREYDIRELCLREWQALGHRPFGIDLASLSVDDLAAALQQLPAENRQDLVFENVQARMRTSLLMNTGFVIGTGDLSELALGWCTYNGDHMSMYNPNISIPKTLVKFLVQWAAENEFAEPARSVLLDIVGTEISPELLPTGCEGQSTQATEQFIGPYEVLDFFLFHFLRYGSPPAKLLYLAEQAAFQQRCTPAELRKWLRLFLQRFFHNQFKRSCLPDGPKVGSVSLSPRGDWRMPSDASVKLWLAELAEGESSIAAKPLATTEVKGP